MNLLIVSLFCVLIKNVLSKPVLYDQRQTGQTNIQIDLKDVVLIEMLGDLEGDYDYSYDYSDLTVKPEGSTSTAPTLVLNNTSPADGSTQIGIINSTTTERTMVTSTGSTTLQNSSIILETENNTLTFNPNKPSNSSEPNKLLINQNKQPLNSQNYQIPVVIVHGDGKIVEKPAKAQEKVYVSSSEIRKKFANQTSVRTEELPLRHCSQGFFLDSRNRCKKIMKPGLSQRERPQLPFGLRFAQRPENRNV